MNDCILFSYGFDGQGKGTHLEGQAIADTARSDRLAWVHMNARHADTRHWLRENASYLDDIILDALLADETRPRITEINDGLLMILRGVNLNEDARPEDMISIRIWIDPYRIITTQRRNSKAVGDIRELLENGNGPRNAADFLTLLTTRLFIRMEPTVLTLDERTDSVEEAVMDDPKIEERQEIIDIRKQAIILRRYLSPQRDAIANLRNTEIPWLDKIHKRQLQENFDRLSRYVEDLDAIRERAQIVKDELSNVMADKMNKNMYTLSVVAAIFLPLSFLTGLLGINVGGMPGAGNDGAFWIVCGICVTFMVVTATIFKRLKWV